MLNLIFKKLTRMPQSLVYRYRVMSNDSAQRRAALLEEQNAAFAAVGLSRQDGISAAQRACQERLGCDYDETNGMFSEHIIMFAAIACARGKYIRNVLEIGTFDGRTAALLSALFPEAHIKTIDLPSDSPLFSSTYQRSGTVGVFEEKRNALVRSLENVSFASVNSLGLVDWAADSFDLIWVDGAHGAPVVCCDLINAYRLARKGAVVMVDDVLIDSKSNDPMYKSSAAFETLESFRMAGLLETYRLFLKRVQPSFNIVNHKKHVGYFEKR